MIYSSRTHVLFQGVISGNLQTSDKCAGSQVGQSDFLLFEIWLVYLEVPIGKTIDFAAGIKYIKAKYTWEVITMAARTKEERIALIDEKIAKKRAEIASLEAQKEKLLHPITMKAVMSKAKEAGLSPKEIAKKLGINMEE